MNKKQQKNEPKNKTVDIKRNGDKTIMQLHKELNAKGYDFEIRIFPKKNGSAKA